MKQNYYFQSRYKKQIIDNESRVHSLIFCRYVFDLPKDISQDTRSLRMVIIDFFSHSVERKT